MVSLYFLELTDVVQPAQVGFRCHDRELSLPYVDGGDELIPLLMLLSLAFAGPAASVTNTPPVHTVFPTGGVRGGEVLTVHLFYESDHGG